MHINIYNVCHYNKWSLKVNLFTKVFIKRSVLTFGREQPFYLRLCTQLVWTGVIRTYVRFLISTGDAVNRRVFPYSEGNDRLTSIVCPFPFDNKQIESKRGGRHSVKQRVHGPLDYWPVGNGLHSSYERSLSAQCRCTTLFSGTVTQILICFFFILMYYRKRVGTTILR